MPILCYLLTQYYRTTFPEGDDIYCDFVYYCFQWNYSYEWIINKQYADIAFTVGRIL